MAQRVNGLQHSVNDSTRLDVGAVTCSFPWRQLPELCFRCSRHIQPITFITQRPSRRHRSRIRVGCWRAVPFGTDTLFTNRRVFHCHGVCVLKPAASACRPVFSKTDWHRRNVPDTGRGIFKPEHGTSNPLDGELLWREPRPLATIQPSCSVSCAAACCFLSPAPCWQAAFV